MQRAAAGAGFGPFTLLRPLSEQGVRQRWIVRRTSGGDSTPLLLEILPGPLAEHHSLGRPLREELAHLRSFRHPRFTFPGRMALEKHKIGFSFEIPGTRTLEELLDDLAAGGRTLPPSAGIDLVLKLAEALDAFHARPVDPGQPVAHLTLRPAHVFLAPGGEVALSGAWVAPLEHLWPWGPPRGAWPFLAPERVRGEPGGVPADLYALGRILRAVLTLRPSNIEGEDLILGYLQKEPEPPDLSSLADVPVLQTLVADLLNSDPGQRPQSAADVVEALTLARRRLGSGVSFGAFLASIGWVDLDRVAEVQVTDGLQTEEFPVESQLKLASAIARGKGPARDRDLEDPTPDPDLEDNLTFDEPAPETEDPFASLEAALSDLEVTFADLDFPEDDAPRPKASPKPAGVKEGLPRRSVRMGALKKKPDVEISLDDNEPPSLTSVVVDISELLPDEAVAPLDTSRERQTLGWLIQVDKNGNKIRHALDGTPVTIGRSPANTVHISGDGRVSRLHCRITMEDGDFVIEDAGSNNGTLVDGVFIKRQALRGGEEIIIGGTVLQYTAGEKAKRP